MYLRGFLQPKTLFCVVSAFRTAAAKQHWCSRGLSVTRHLTYRYHLALSIMHQQTCYAVPRREFSPQSFQLPLLLYLQLNRKLLP